MDYNFSNHSAEEIKSLVEEKPFSHFVVDDFLDEMLFKKLDEDFLNFYNKCGVNLQSVLNTAKNNSNHKLTETNEPIVTWGKQLHEMSGGMIDKSFRLQGANVHHNDRTFGYTIDYGGNGKVLDSFQSLCNFSSVWSSFLNIIYSKEFFDYMFFIFEETKEYKDRIANKKINKCYNNKIENPKHLNYFTGTKINRYMDNYGWFLHPDTSDKVLSFLLYMDNSDWPDDLVGNGTQLWGFGENNFDYNSKEKFKYNNNTIDFQLRDARTKEAGLLTDEQKKKMKIYKNIDFKPNRLVGFIRSDNSWHSILPMELPELVTRNCFQINVWECSS